MSDAASTASASSAANLIPNAIPYSSSGDFFSKLFLEYGLPFLFSSIYLIIVTAVLFDLITTGFFFVTVTSATVSSATVYSATGSSTTGSSATVFLAWSKNPFG